MTPEDIKQVGWQVVIEILTKRTLLLFGMLSSFVLAVWAMWVPTWQHGAFALGYGLLCWVYANVQRQ